jgi:hypothetical protein
MVKSDTNIVGEPEVEPDCVEPKNTQHVEKEAWVAVLYAGGGRDVGPAFDTITCNIPGVNSISSHSNDIMYLKCSFYRQCDRSFF